MILLTKKLNFCFLDIKYIIDNKAMLYLPKLNTQYYDMGTVYS